MNNETAPLTTVAVDPLVSDFLCAKRKIQGDAVADATSVEILPDGKFKVTLPCGRNNTPWRPFICDGAMLKIMTDDLYR